MSRSLIAWPRRLGLRCPAGNGYSHEWTTTSSLRCTDRGSVQDAVVTSPPTSRSLSDGGAVVEASSGSPCRAMGTSPRHGLGSSERTVAQTRMGAARLTLTVDTALWGKVELDVGVGSTAAVVGTSPLQRGGSSAVEGWSGASSSTSGLKNAGPDMMEVGVATAGPDLLRLSPSC